MKQVYSYLRFSAAKQAEGNSADRQQQYAEEWAAKHGLVLDSALSMRDEGLSAYHPPNPGALFAFAGLLAAWKAPDGETIVSTCIITTGPNEVMEPIHDRMPVILSPDQFDDWLDPTNSDPRKMLRPCDPALMAAHPVKPLRSDGPECVEPLKLR